MSEKRQILLEALIDAIEAAPQAKREPLQAALEDYETTYPGSVRGRVGIARDLMGAIDMASQAVGPGKPCEHCEAPDLHPGYKPEPATCRGCISCGPPIVVKAEHRCGEAPTPPCNPDCGANGAFHVSCDLFPGEGHCEHEDYTSALTCQAECPYDE